MSGISVTEDAVNLFYYLKAKSAVPPPFPCLIETFPAHATVVVISPSYNLRLLCRGSNLDMFPELQRALLWC